MSEPTLVVVGASLGGLAGLRVLLAGLPREWLVPIAVVQHRVRDADDLLALALQEACPLRVLEPRDKEPLREGHVYLAPGDYHLLVEGDHLALSTEAPVLHSRPSIDVLFESAAEARGPGVVGVVLGGASGDGARGAARIKARGGAVVVEDPDEAEAPAMPRAALASADEVLPLAAIPAWLSARVRRSA